MAYLRLILAPIVLADQTIKPTNDELFANVSLEVFDAAITDIVFTQKWDSRCLIDWFIKSKDSLLLEEIPSFLNPNLPTISAIDNLFNNYDELTLDTVIEQLYTYRLTHDFRFGMRGTEIPSIIICRKTSYYEISWINAMGCHVYQIDLFKFIDSLICFAHSEIYSSLEPRYLSECIHLC